MNRRSFLSSMIGGVSAAAAVRTWPFRVFSFPSEIAKPQFAVRFTRTFDHVRDKFVNRWDILNGFGVLAAAPFSGSDLIVEGKTIADVMTHLRSNPAGECYALSELHRIQNARFLRSPQ